MNFRPSLPVPGPRIISMQSFTSLLLIIISVSFIVFLLAFDSSNHCLRLLNTAHPGEVESRVGEEQLQVESRGGEEQPQLEAEASGGRAFPLKRKNDSERKFTWLQKFKLKLKSVGDKGHDGA